MCKAEASMMEGAIPAQSGCHNNLMKKCICGIVRLTCHACGAQNSCCLCSRISRCVRCECAWGRAERKCTNCQVERCENGKPMPKPAINTQGTKYTCSCDKKPSPVFCPVIKHREEDQDYYSVQSVTEAVHSIFGPEIEIRTEPDMSNQSQGLCLTEKRGRDHECSSGPTVVQSILGPVIEKTIGPDYKRPIYCCKCAGKQHCKFCECVRLKRDCVDCRCFICLNNRPVNAFPEVRDFISVGPFKCSNTQKLTERRNKSIWSLPTPECTTLSLVRAPQIVGGILLNDVDVSTGLSDHSYTCPVESQPMCTDELDEEPPSPPAPGYGTILNPNCVIPKLTEKITWVNNKDTETSLVVTKSHKGATLIKVTCDKKVRIIDGEKLDLGISFPNVKPSSEVGKLMQTDGWHRFIIDSERLQKAADNIETYGTVEGNLLNFREGQKEKRDPKLGSVSKCKQTKRLLTEIKRITHGTIGVSSATECKRVTIGNSLNDQSVVGSKKQMVSLLQTMKPVPSMNSCVRNKPVSQFCLQTVSFPKGSKTGCESVRCEIEPGYSSDVSIGKEPLHSVPLAKKQESDHLKESPGANIVTQNTPCVSHDNATRKRMEKFKRDCSRQEKRFREAVEKTLLELDAERDNDAPCEHKRFDPKILDGWLTAVCKGCGRPTKIARVRTLD